MKHSAKYISKETLLYSVILSLIISSLAFTLKAIEAASSISSWRLQAGTSFPTSGFPSDWARQTQDTVIQQTQQARALTPWPTGTLWSFPFYISTSVPIATLPVTPAGDGEISDYGTDQALSKLIGVNALNAWQVEVGGKRITVFAGSDYSDPLNLQGAVYVNIFDIYETGYGRR